MIRSGACYKCVELREHVGLRVAPFAPSALRRAKEVRSWAGRTNARPFVFRDEVARRLEGAEA